jgi:porphobilinogen synthase
MNLIRRPRRLRDHEALREMVKETRIHPTDLIQPLFAVHGTNVKKEIAVMPNQFHFSVDRIGEEVKELQDAGIRSVLLFGLPDTKDSAASEAFAEDGIVQQAVREIRRAVPEMLVMTDVCLCQYTDHGHCGIIEEERILNDASLSVLAKTALSHAMAGAHVVAPSDMMDGRVAAIRETLDAHDLQQVSIMSYSVKYASAFYSPFRQAVASAPRFGDRKTYQMDPANRREALLESALDIEEGADLLMVKPALAYLDIIREVRNAFPHPLGAYHVSGEYAMVKAAVNAGLLDNDRIMTEILTSIKRAGADVILTYFAKEMALLLKRT